MSYQVIARKWRPQTFDEVTGQEPITQTLKNAIEHERLHHAYLFSGARGVGKTTTARLLAKALNCHKSKRPTPTPCAVNDPTACVSCREIAEGRSIDVLEIDAASNTGVDNVREAIISSVAIAPARDRYKVFIIDEVHMLSSSAFNALLKTLEEPPPRVVFIMATTELHKVPDTILSRCQQFEFRTIAAAKIAERLRLIAKAEKVKITDEALREIARAGEGSMRDAQSAFDQVISFSGTEIKTEDVETALGIAGAEMLARVVNGIAAHNAAEALAVVDDLVMRGHDLRNFCRELLAHLRDLLVVKVSGERAELLDSSAMDARELARQAEDFSEADLVRFFHSLTETESSLRDAAHPRYQLEVGLVKLMEMRSLAPLNRIIERLNALEEALRTGRAPAKAETPPASSSSGGASNASGRRGTSAAGGPASRASALHSSEKEISESALRATSSPFSMADSSKPASAVAASQATAARLKPLTLVPPSGTSVEDESETAAHARPFFEAAREVEDVAEPVMPAASLGGNASLIERIKTALEGRKRMLLVTALERARRVRVEDDELCVEFAPEMKHLRDSLAKPEGVKVLQEVCSEVAGRDMGVRISVREANDDEPRSQEDEERRERQRLRELAEQHPDVQQVLRTFRAEIVDVKRASGPQAEHGGQKAE